MMIACLLPSAARPIIAARISARDVRHVLGPRGPPPPPPPPVIQDGVPGSYMLARLRTRSARRVSDLDKFVTKLYQGKLTVLCKVSRVCVASA